MNFQEVGAIKYSVTPINFKGEIEFSPYLDAGIVNEDSTYDEFFWETLEQKEKENEAYIMSKTLKTEFLVWTGMKVELILNDYLINIDKEVKKTDKSISYAYKTMVKSGDTFSIVKYGGYTQSMNHPDGELLNVSQQELNKAADLGFEALLDKTE